MMKTKIPDEVQCSGDPIKSLTTVSWWSQKGLKTHAEDKDSLWGTMQGSSHWESHHCLLMLTEGSQDLWWRHKDSLWGTIQESSHWGSHHWLLMLTDGSQDSCWRQNILSNDDKWILKAQDIKEVTDPKSITSQSIRSFTCITCRSLQKIKKFSQMMTNEFWRLKTSRKSQSRKVSQVKALEASHA